MKQKKLRRFIAGAAVMAMAGAMILPGMKTNAAEVSEGEKHISFVVENEVGETSPFTNEDL